MFGRSSTASTCLLKGCGPSVARALPGESLASMNEGSAGKFPGKPRRAKERTGARSMQSKRVTARSARHRGRPQSQHGPTQGASPSAALSVSLLEVAKATESVEYTVDSVGSARRAWWMSQSRQKFGQPSRIVADTSSCLSPAFQGQTAGETCASLPALAGTALLLVFRCPHRH